MPAQRFNYTSSMHRWWCRVEERNVQKGETYPPAFDITREVSYFVEGLWQPPTEVEMLAHRICTSGI
jgi:hypothetical protein